MAEYDPKITEFTSELPLTIGADVNGAIIVKFKGIQFGDLPKYNYSACAKRSAKNCPLCIYGPNCSVKL